MYVHFDTVFVHICVQHKGLCGYTETIRCRPKTKWRDFIDWIHWRFRVHTAVKTNGYVHMSIFSHPPHTQVSNSCRSVAHKNLMYIRVYNSRKHSHKYLYLFYVHLSMATTILRLYHQNLHSRTHMWRICMSLTYLLVILSTHVPCTECGKYFEYRMCLYSVRYFMCSQNYIHLYIHMNTGVCVGLHMTYEDIKGGGSGGGVHLPCTYRNMSSCRPGDHFKYRILRSESNRQLKRQQQSHGHVGVVVKFANTCKCVCMCFLLREHILVIATWRIDKEEKRRRCCRISPMLSLYSFLLLFEQLMCECL